MSFRFCAKNSQAVYDHMKSYMKLNPPDCSFFTENGEEIPIHKELLFQTDFMHNILKSCECCCSKIEIIFPFIPIEELDLMIEFLYTGQFSCNSQNIAKKTIFNLEEYLGFSNIVDLTDTYSNILKKQETNHEPFSMKEDNKDILDDSKGEHFNQTRDFSSDLNQNDFSEAQPTLKNDEKDSHEKEGYIKKTKDIIKHSIDVKNKIPET